MTKRHFAYTGALLAIALCLTACSDSALVATSKAMVDISAGNLAIQSTVITAQQSGAITADEARPVIQLTVEIATAGKNVNTAIAGISTLAPADKTKILAILGPVITSVQNEATTLNIANPTVKTAILATLATIQAALATVRVALGG